MAQSSASVLCTLACSILLFACYTAGQDNAADGAANVLPAFYRHTFAFSVKKGINRNIVSTYFNVQFSQFKREFPLALNGYSISSKLNMNWFRTPDYDVGGWLDFPTVQAMQQYFQWRKTNPYSFYTRNYITQMAQLQVAVGSTYAVDAVNQYRWICLFTVRKGVDPKDMRATLAGILRGHIDDLGYPGYIGATNYLGTDLGINRLLYKGANHNVAMIMDFSSLYNMQNFTQMFVNHPLINNLKQQMQTSTNFHYRFSA